MTRHLLPIALGVFVSSLSGGAHAVDSAEFYTSASYRFGRVEAEMKFAAGDGVVGSFFLWKDGSERSGTFWNELDFEKVGADCQLATNAFFGNPGATHTQDHTLAQDLCGGFHVYAYEWTPEYIAWSVDGVEIRRETGETATAYAENANPGMQIRFNIWPGDASFGGNFSESILPVYQYVNWVQYSSYVDGAFQLQWREDFTGTDRPTGWLLGGWKSPKGLSEHKGKNVTVADGNLVLALTVGDGAGGAASTQPTGGATFALGGQAGAVTDEGGDDGGCSLGRFSSRRDAGVAALLVVGMVTMVRRPWRRGARR